SPAVLSRPTRLFSSVKAVSAAQARLFSAETCTSACPKQAKRVQPPFPARFPPLLNEESGQVILETCTVPRQRGKHHES
ncbi:MAG TPA: hypothetical protein PKE31_12930, partial [Pseudomonadota bacterium]|nr:hypothetical protein [Pseudomonadota bacterium]